MTEATDRPPDPASTTAADDAPKSYSSVSPLAIGGFALAAAYSLVIAVGALIALFNRTPWVLTIYSLGIPLVAIVVCWAARSGIASSEGALTGMKLTTWGLYLSFGFGLVYGAYYAACYLSVSQMATGFTDEWVEDLKTDQLDKAFLLTVAPPRPNADANLRSRLEMDYDRGPQGRGKFSEFRQSQMVRQFEQGDRAQVQFLGVQSWSYEAGGYKVLLAYRVATAVATCELQIQVIGVENADDANGRQWYVRDYQPLKQTMTPEGARMMDKSNQARQFAQKWLAKVAHWDWDDAYLDTAPPAERERQRKEQGPDFKEGLSKFRAGAFVRADPATFWTAEKEKGKTAADIRGMFGHGGENPDKFTLLTTPSTYQRDAEQVRFGFDIVTPLPPDLGVQGRLVVALDAREDEPTMADWRIDSLELFSAKSEAGGPPGMPPGARPGGSPGPNMRPPGGP